MNGNRHKGWEINYNPSRPVTGVWRAERFGVGMCAGTFDALIRMIDTKIAEERLQNEKA